MPQLQHTLGLLIGYGLVVAVAVGCSSDGRATGAAAGDDAVKDEYKLEQQFALSMAVTSTKFNATRRIPRQYSCTREGISPPISWGEAPAGTMSLALVVDSNQHAGPPWVHWVLWGIPADAQSLPEEVPNTALAPSVGPNAAQGTNTEAKIGWTGPCPSPVLLSRGHQESAVATYTFKLFALDTELTLGTETTKNDLLEAIDGHILAGGELVGEHVSNVQCRMSGGQKLNIKDCG